MLTKLKNEPVLVIALVVALAITLGLVTLEQVQAFAALVPALMVLFAGLLARSQVSPLTTQPQRHNAVVAETMARIARGDIDPLDGGE